MISIKVELDSKEASAALAEVISCLTGPEAAGLNAVGGRAAQQAAAKYHRDFDQSGGWRGKRYLGSGSGEGGRFGSDVARGWKFDAADAGGATISNDATYYAFKVSGGTITPKRVKFLTIPLVPEARGLRAATFAQNTGQKLFRPKGKRVLAVKDGKGIRSIYALVSSITQGPWPGAVPPEETLAGAFGEAWREALADHLEEGPA